MRLFTKISDAEMAGKGVIGQATVPGLSTLAMQQSVEQIVREVAIPGVNRLVAELGDAAAAQSIGAQMPEGMGEGQTVQQALDGLAGQTVRHTADTDNPHRVTAAQTGAYTKSETDDVIDRKMIEIGTGDMAKATYDPERKEKPYIPAEEALSREDYGGSETGVVREADRLHTPRGLGNAQFDGGSDITLKEMGAAAQALNVNMFAEGLMQYGTGIQMEWGSLEIEKTVISSPSGGVYTANTGTLVFNTPFAEPPLLLAFWESAGTYVGVAAVNVSETGVGHFTLFRGVNSEVSGKINYFAIGRAAEQ